MFRAYETLTAWCGPIRTTEAEAYADADLASATRHAQGGAGHFRVITEDADGFAVYRNGDPVRPFGPTAPALRFGWDRPDLPALTAELVELGLNLTDDGDGRAWTADGSAGVAIDESGRLIDESGRIIILDADGVPNTRDGSGRVDSAAAAAREIRRLVGPADE